jgi:hypothetical protein
VLVLGKLLTFTSNTTVYSFFTSYYLVYPSILSTLACKILLYLYNYYYQKDIYINLTTVDIYTLNHYKYYISNNIIILIKIITNKLILSIIYNNNNNNISEYIMEIEENSTK